MIFIPKIFKNPVKKNPITKANKKCVSLFILLTFALKIFLLFSFDVFYK
jgi:hypothetical protein